MTTAPMVSHVVDVSILNSDACGGLGSVEVIVLSDTESESDYQSPDEGYVILEQPLSGHSQNKWSKGLECCPQHLVDIVVATEFNADHQKRIKGKKRPRRENVQANKVTSDLPTFNKKPPTASCSSTAKPDKPCRLSDVILYSTDVSSKSISVEEKSNQKSWQTIEVTVVSGSDSEFDYDDNYNFQSQFSNTGGNGCECHNNPEDSYDNYLNYQPEMQVEGRLRNQQEHQRKTGNVETGLGCDSVSSESKLTTRIKNVATTPNMTTDSQCRPSTCNSINRQEGPTVLQDSEKDEDDDEGLSFFTKVVREKQQLETSKRIYPAIMKVVGRMLDVAPDELVGAAAPDTEFAYCVRQSYYEKDSNDLWDDDWQSWRPDVPTSSSDQDTIHNCYKNMTKPSFDSDFGKQRLNLQSNALHETKEAASPRNYYHMAFISDMEASQSSQRIGSKEHNLSNKNTNTLGRQNVDIPDATQLNDRSQYKKSRIPKPNTQRELSESPSLERNTELSRHSRQNKGNGSGHHQTRRIKDSSCKSLSKDMSQSIAPPSMKGTNVIYANGRETDDGQTDKFKRLLYMTNRQGSTKLAATSGRTSDKRDGQKHNEKAHSVERIYEDKRGVKTHAQHFMHKHDQTQTQTQNVADGGRGLDTESQISLEKQLQNSKRIIERLTEQMGWMETGISGHQQNSRQQPSHEQDQGDIETQQQRFGAARLHSRSRLTREKHRKPGSPMVSQISVPGRVPYFPFFEVIYLKHMYVIGKGFL